MVENQIRTNRVVDPLVIATLGELPREAFVPETLKGLAYIDEDLPLGRGRYLMEPLVTALLLQALEIGPDDVCLDIGCGPGYASAVMAKMANTVVALEADPELARFAQSVLAELELDNVAVIEGPLAEGYAGGGPYDVILINGGVAEIPSAIRNQLAEGGRLAAVVDNGKGIGKGTLFTRIGDVVSGREVFDASTPRLPGFDVQPGFVF